MSLLDSKTVSVKASGEKPPPKPPNFLGLLLIILVALAGERKTKGVKR